MIADVLEPQINKLKTLMRNEGIIFPSVTPDYPKVNEQTIPPGGKHLDQEIANMLVVLNQGLLTYCWMGLQSSIRDDIGGLFYQFQGQVLSHNMSLKHTMGKRGWLRVPPPYQYSTVASPHA